MAAAASMSSTRRSAVWGFIILLASLAFLRSLAPERTEKAVRHLISDQGTSDAEQRSAEASLAKEKEELERERAALKRWKEDLNRQEQELKAKKTSSTQPEKRETTSVDDLDITFNKDDPDAFTDSSSNREQQQTDSEHTSGEASEEGVQNVGHADEGAAEKSDLETEEEVPNLNNEECPIIVIPESTGAGLGLQVEHVWSSLSLTLAVRNACLVIPPVMADDGTENYRPVPFGELFDEASLADTGLRFVPLKTCQKHGVSSVFDDAGAESAIVKNFAAFVQESYPRLAKESTLVHADSAGWRFLNESETNGDVNVVARYIQSKLPEKPGRQCIGIGRMRARIAVNPDVLEHFKAASSISEYVTERFPHANETLFIKLRWNRAHCGKARTENGSVCIVTDNIVPTEEYVHAIAYTASSIGASSIYMSAPAHIPEDVSAYISSQLKTLDPIILDVEGDTFTANIIERELALHAKRFISDGGAWGETIQKVREKQNTETSEEGLTSFEMIEEWKSAGRPRDSSFLINPQTAEAGSTENSSSEVDQQIEGDGSADTNEKSLGNDSDSESFHQDNQVEAEIRPTEYIPPDSFVPTDDDEEELQHFRSLQEERDSGEDSSTVTYDEGHEE